MNLWMLSGPIVGAIIGYFTNNIAVKMLFRPLHPVKIGNFTLPFTPGLIPKGQGRLAKSIGKTVGEQLLTEEVFEDKLLSDEMKGKVADFVEGFFRSQMENEKTVYETLEGVMPKEQLDEKRDALEEVVIGKIEYYLKEMKLGNIVASQVLKAVKQYVQGSFLAMMISDDFLMPIAQKIEEQVDHYMEYEGMVMITAVIHSECENLLEQTVGHYVEKLEPQLPEIRKMSTQIYETVVREKVPGLVEQLNFSQMVEDKVNEMDVEQVEELVLSIMRKELKAVVNLGAVIGFVIGCINMFI